MTTNLWHYLVNQFLVSTRTSFKKAFSLSNYHNAALLQATKDYPDDADYQMLYDRYNPVHVKFVNTYTAWDSAGGNQQSETLNVTQLLEQMTDQLDEWEPDILKVCKKKTPAYKKIFPDERKPFYRGGIDERIAAVKTLAENMGDNPKLADVKKGVLDYWKSLDEARTAQDGSKMSKGNQSSEVEACRIAAMQIQYADTGFLMNKFYLTPEKVAKFFDLTLLRDIEQSLFTGTLKAHTLKNVFVRTLAAASLLRIRNTGARDLQVSLSNVADAMANPVIMVAAGEEKMIPVADFGVVDLHLYRYLNIENGADEDTSFEVEIE